MGQAAFGGFLLLESEPLHKQCFLYLSICLMIVFGSKKVLIAKVGKALKIALVSSNLPAWLKKEEILTNLLSHFVTKGQKSATVGLERLRGRPK
jgi:hypothetical protein